MAHDIRQQSPEITNILFAAGNRKVIFVEGQDDLSVFDEWFEEYLDEIYFYSQPGKGGCEKVKKLLEETLEKSHKKEIYGIIDRDFRSELEIADSMSETSHLFILKRYAIENYLLEPSAVWEELRLFPSKSFGVFDLDAVEKTLYEICDNLKTVMAANWVILESATGADYFNEKYDINNRQNIIQQTAKRMQLEVQEIEQKIAEKENLIQLKLNRVVSRNLRWYFAKRRI